jgi:predicted nucleotide-binding protein (sugar kinase/HSP70/actin superfamily)
MAQLSVFFTQSLLNMNIKKKAYISRTDIKGTLAQPVMILIERFMEEINRCLDGHPFLRPLHTPRHLAKLAEPVLNLVNQYGEGWLIAAEARAMARQGIQEVLCLQPFGCIANQVIAKGIERRLRQLHPRLRILFADLDPDTSPANLFNRLHFLVQGARESARASALLPVT